MGQAIIRLHQDIHHGLSFGNNIQDVLQEVANIVDRHIIWSVPMFKKYMGPMNGISFLFAVYVIIQIQNSTLMNTTLFL